MTIRSNGIGLTLLALLIAVVIVPISWGEESRSEHGSLARPSQAAEKSAGTEKRPEVINREATLEEVLEFAEGAYNRIDKEISDYTCVLFRREYVNGEVYGWQSLTAKIRHEKKVDGEVKVPLSVYVRFLKPEKMSGRAVIYVAGQNNGDLIGRRGGRRSPNMTVQLAPDSPLAMEGNRYPITEIGFKNLAKRLIEVLQQEMEYKDGQIQVWENARVGDRLCTHYRLTHREKRPNLTYHNTEVSVDNELGIPIRYGAYDFPKEQGGQPQLLEQYIYTRVQLNVGLTDKDFDHRNPAYKFQLREEGE